MLRSGIYEGDVFHHRYEPTAHFFRYRVAMMLLDLEELDSIFDRFMFWSSKRFNIGWFRRSDHVGNDCESLQESICNLIGNSTGESFAGRISLLTNPRYFGFGMNPISVYYCFSSCNRLDYVVAEVTNTPWNERHCYVLDLRNEKHETKSVVSQKKMHVSPFMSMDFDYQFRIKAPGEKLSLTIENLSPCGKQKFAAGLSMKRREFTTSNLNRLLMRFPFATFQTFVRIYWQAFRLWWKKVPFIPHPDKTNPKTGDTA